MPVNLLCFLAARNEVKPGTMMCLIVIGVGCLLDLGVPDSDSCDMPVSS